MCLLGDCDLRETFSIEENFCIQQKGKKDASKSQIIIGKHNCRIGWHRKANYGKTFLSLNIYCCG